MKKVYVTPALVAARIQCQSMMVTSVPVTGETDDEARSRKYWGKAPWETSDEEEETEDSWF